MNLHIGILIFSIFSRVVLNCTHKQCTFERDTAPLQNSHAQYTQEFILNKNNIKLIKVPLQL